MALCFVLFLPGKGLKKKYAATFFKFSFYLFTKAKAGRIVIGLSDFGRWFTFLIKTVCFQIPNTQQISMEEKYSGRILNGNVISEFKTCWK